MGLSIGILGTGRVARRNYIPFLAEQDDLSLWYYSRTPAKAQACADEFGGQVVASPAELVAAAPDAIFVLTMEQDRFTAASALLAHGPRRLFFEKPLVAEQGQAHVTPDDFYKARTLLQQAQSMGTETAMVFNYRFFTQIQNARRLVSEREFGRPIQAMALTHYACWSRTIDLILTCAGPVAQISALAGVGERGSGPMAAPDLAASFRLTNGATGTILGTAGIHFDFPLFELVLSYEHGRIHLRDLDGEMEVLDYRSARRERFSLLDTVSRWDQYEASFQKSVAAYLDTVRAHQPPPVPGLAGLAELQFEAALKQSVAMGRPIQVEEEFPLQI